MRTPARFLLLLLLATAELRAGDGREEAGQAQRLLGPEFWSRVIRIENDARVSRYPRVLHALVFEVAGILWFYTATDGTQSFSLREGRVEEEKADFGPLLRDIEPGFRRWRTIAEPGPERRGGPALPNACFIASVAALQQLRHHGAAAAQPRLLSYYFNTPEGRQGHTVLTYRTAGGMAVIDPTESAAPTFFPAALGDNAAELARALEGAPVARARWVPVELPLDLPLRAAARLAGDIIVHDGATAPPPVAALE